MSTWLVACGGGGGGVDQAAECGFPTPRVAGTAATDTLANAPGRCDIADYLWLRDPSLGEVVQRHELFEFTPQVLEQIALAEGLPIQPVYATAVERITYKTQDRGKLIEATAMIKLSIR